MKQEPYEVATRVEKLQVAAQPQEKDVGEAFFFVTGAKKFACTIVALDKDAALVELEGTRQQRIVPFHKLKRAVKL